MSFVQMHRLRNDICMSFTLQLPDLSVSENDNMLTLFIRLLLQQKVVQMFFMPKHINLENFMQID